MTESTPLQEGDIKTNRKTSAHSELRGDPPAPGVCGSKRAFIDLFQKNSQPIQSDGKSPKSQKKIRIAK